MNPINKQNQTMIIIILWAEVYHGTATYHKIYYKQLIYQVYWRRWMVNCFLFIILLYEPREEDLSLVKFKCFLVLHRIFMWSIKCFVQLYNIISVILNFYSWHSRHVSLLPLWLSCVSTPPNPSISYLSRPRSIGHESVKLPRPTRHWLRSPPMPWSPSKFVGHEDPPRAPAATPSTTFSPPPPLQNGPLVPTWPHVTISTSLVPRAALKQPYRGYSYLEASPPISPFVTPLHLHTLPCVTS